MFACVVDGQKTLRKKSTETPGESANKKRLDIENHIIETGVRRSGIEDL